jgi:hypothetical protein
MRAQRFRVVDRVWIVAARRYGRTLLLAVVTEGGGPYRIRFRFASRAEAEHHRGRVLDWLRRRTALSYVTGGRESVLVETDALLARATA